jgi:hypothetical protein
MCNDVVGLIVDQVQKLKGNCGAVHVAQLLKEIGKDCGAVHVAQLLKEIGKDCGAVHVAQLLKKLGSELAHGAARVVRVTR